MTDLLHVYVEADFSSDDPDARVKVVARAVPIARRYGYSVRDVVRVEGPLQRFGETVWAVQFWQQKTPPAG